MNYQGKIVVVIDHEDQTDRVGNRVVQLSATLDSPMALLRCTFGPYIAGKLFGDSEERRQHPHALLEHDLSGPVNAAFHLEYRDSEEPDDFNTRARLCAQS